MGRTNGGRPKEPTPPAESKPKPKQAAKKSSVDYTSEGVVDNDVFLLPFSDYQWMFAITALSALVRLFRIYQPTSVVFDEVHFGGFASKYIKGRFFMDVHPPLAKLLITLAGWLAGFDGNFDFKEIGKDYLEANVPYVAMRMVPAICGILLAPAMFLTLKALGARTATAVMGACFIIFENGLLTQARLILLDSPLMIATAFTVLSFTSFTNQHELGPSRAFNASWWFWLVMTGLGLGITVSIKWVGLFTIAWVGCFTLVQLWVLLGDTKNVTLRIWTKHFMARVFCLIVIPLTFYMAMFAIHFLCLVNPGDGDGFMSSEFQSTLNSKGMADSPVDVVYGSRVTIRHWNTQGGYLHSHPLMYPGGSKQQQVTLYPHKDDNNLWLFENQTQPIGPDGQQINGTKAWDQLPEPIYIKDGDIVRLYHMTTHRRLHTHDVRPPITEADWQNEVSAYGYEGFDGDANDFFRIEIVKKKSIGPIAKERLRTIQTKFRLIHIMTGCTLFSHKVKLPEWASEQQEVTCARGGTLPNSIWYVETNDSPKLGPDAEKVNYVHPGFFGKFWELQKVMWKTNAGLVESHAWDSRPGSWPILRRGINFWGKDHRQIYLIGNPVVWYLSTLAVAVYVVFKGLAILRWQRGCGDYANVTFKRFDYEIGTTIVGWALHYFPFYLMQRQLFLHHYFPALYFAILAFCQIFDYVTARVTILNLKNNPIINRATATSLLALALVAFVLLSPLAYGNAWTKAECKRVKLFSTWDWDCNTFLDDYASYARLPSTSAAAVHQTAQPSVDPNQPPPEVPVQQQAQQEAQQVVYEPPAQPVAGEEGLVSAAPLMPEVNAMGQRVLSREERVEYRDQDGNLLDPEQVKALEGKVEFRTRYETRTRIVDAYGNEIAVHGEGEDARAVPLPPPPGYAPQDAGNAGAQQAVPEAAGVAPPHPDAEGVETQTGAKAVAAGKVKPDDPLPEGFKVKRAAAVNAEVSNDGENESERSKAKPASESGAEETA